MPSNDDVVVAADAGASEQTQVQQMDTNERREAPQATVENIVVAMEAIHAMAQRRRLVVTIEGEESAELDIPAFGSKKQAQKFRQRLGRAMRRPGMKAANVFLRYFDVKDGDKTTRSVRVEYSPKEKSIRAKREALRHIVKALHVARRDYLLEKGDFYGGRVRVAPSVGGTVA